MTAKHNQETRDTYSSYNTYLALSYNKL